MRTGGDFLLHGAVSGVRQLWCKFVDDVQPGGVHAGNGFIGNGAALRSERIGNIGLGHRAGLIEIAQRANADGQGLRLLGQRVVFQGCYGGGAAHDHLSVADLFVQGFPPLIRKYRTIKLRDQTPSPLIHHRNRWRKRYL